MVDEILCDKIKRQSVRFKLVTGFEATVAYVNPLDFLSCVIGTVKVLSKVGVPRGCAWVGNE